MINNSMVIDELCQENEYLREKLRDTEDRSQRNNLSIDGLKEVENETWEQIEKISKSMTQENRETKDVKNERAHTVGNTTNISPRTLVSAISRKLLQTVCWFVHQKKEPKNSSSALPKSLFLYETDKVFFCEIC